MGIIREIFIERVIAKQDGRDAFVYDCAASRLNHGPYSKSQCKAIAGLWDEQFGIPDHHAFLGLVLAEVFGAVSLQDKAYRAKRWHVPADLSMRVDQVGIDALVGFANELAIHPLVGRNLQPSLNSTYLLLEEVEAGAGVRLVQPLAMFLAEDANRLKNWLCLGTNAGTGPFDEALLAELGIQHASLSQKDIDAMAIKYRTADLIERASDTAATSSMALELGI